MPMVNHLKLWPCLNSFGRVLLSRMTFWILAGQWNLDWHLKTENHNILPLKTLYPNLMGRFEYDWIVQHLYDHTNRIVT